MNMKKRIAALLALCLMLGCAMGALAEGGALNDLLGIPEGEDVDINGVINNLLAELGITLDING